MRLRTLDFEVDAGMSLGLLGWNETYFPYEKNMHFGGPGVESYRLNVSLLPPNLYVEISPLKWLH